MLAPKAPNAKTRSKVLSGLALRAPSTCSALTMCPQFLGDHQRVKGLGLRVVRPGDYDGLGFRDLK